MKSHALFSLSSGGAVLSPAQSGIVSFDFAGPTTAPASVALNATATSFNISSGGFAPVSLVFGNPAPAAAANNWSAAPIPLSNAKHYEFTVTADPGYALQLTSFSFDNFSPDLPGPGNGPTTYAVALNGTLVAGPLPTSVNTWGAVTVPLAFTGPSALVQIFAWGGTGIPLVPAIVQGWAVDNVVLEGAVIPEPAAAAGVAGVGLLGFVLWRRRKS